MPSNYRQAKLTVPGFTWPHYALQIACRPDGQLLIVPTEVKKHSFATPVCLGFTTGMALSSAFVPASQCGTTPVALTWP